MAEIEAEEVGASLKWATAKVERTSQRGPSDRSQGRDRRAERGCDFNDSPPCDQRGTPVPSASAPGGVGSLSRCSREVQVGSAA